MCMNKTKFRNLFACFTSNVRKLRRYGVLMSNWKTTNTNIYQMYSAHRIGCIRSSVGSQLPAP
jgi:hypothetical protein